MNEIEKLIKELCPDGVEFRELGALGSFYGGLSGKTKQDFQNGNAKYISYMNVYANPSVNLDVMDYVHVAANERQHQVQYGDVLFTGSSEVLNECGMSSVVTELLDEPIYLNSFCFGYRLYKENEFNPDFLKHLFRSPNLRILISKTASGVTRFNVSKKKMERIKIPVPPLEVQEKIVKVLDKMMQLEAALEAELSLRRQQYEYYRNALLTFDLNGGGSCNPLWARILELCPDGVEFANIGSIGTLVRGSGLQKKDFVESGVGCIHYGQIYTYYGFFTDKTKTFVKPELATKLKKVKKNDLIIATTSENVDDICKAVAWLGDEDIVTGGHATILKHNQNPKYLSYYFQSDIFNKEKRKYVGGTKVMDISVTKLEKILIPIPPLEIQEQIVEILDKFDKLTNDLTEGLPAEIKARRQQYEYYRNRLLSFPEKTAKFS